MEPLTLHAVVVHKPIELNEARQLVADITRSKKKRYVRETPHSYRFRIVPKTRFGSFISKPINDHITLVFGHLL